MKKVLLIYEDFHPVFTPEEVLLQLWAQLELTPQQTCPFITLAGERDILRDFVFLFKGQYVYMEIPNPFTQRIVAYWAFVYINGKGTAIITPKALHLDMYKKNPSPLAYKESFFLGLAVYNAMNRGLRYFIIDTLGLNLMDSVEDFLGAFSFKGAKNHQEEFLGYLGESTFLFLSRNNKEQLTTWLLETTSINYHIREAGSFYKEGEEMGDFKDIGAAVFIERDQEWTKDYQYFKEKTKTFGLPQFVIYNHITPQQNTFTDKQLIKEYLNHQVIPIKKKIGDLL